MALEEFHGVQKVKEGGFHTKAVPAGGRADEGMSGMLLGAGRFVFFEESESFLQSLSLQRDRVLLMKYGAKLCASC